jgi:acyl-CoA thioesterase FadM
MSELKSDPFVWQLRVYFEDTRLDDELLVSAELPWVKGVKQGFRQVMTRKSDGVVVATAELSAVMLHADSLKPARMPAWIKAELLENAE